MARAFRTYIGIDLGGARGKTTAVARLTVGHDGEAVVQQVSNRSAERSPWYDEVLLRYLAQLPAAETVVAIDAPLTLPACIRCVAPACPGQQACEDPAVVWLNTVGAELTLAETLADRDRIAAVPTPGRPAGSPVRTAARARPMLTPYTHRPTAVVLRHARGIKTRETLGQGSGPITARATHLRRALQRSGYELNRNLIEVSPRATVHALFDERKARGYKRDADPWETRAEIVEHLSHSLRFAPTSCFSREQVLRNDHCFEALLSAYTAHLWARDDWQLPAGEQDLFDTDGWIWTPPDA
jgi:predicted nuclease with RNAse H fold